ncbi:MAG: RNA polymerase factor sigma-54 [Candidatus Eisenbacteria bacterium]|uniref:RNA polymerase factor sigma-54 n=1 Tax=Eiseniibacteriota bacterium TaxID=2212470 RepID=A0A948RSK4_UNCEI|nr:RNA polymerase factor sigma-54 [Candidatus Eisenbacteria bacterium]
MRQGLHLGPRLQQKPIITLKIQQALKILQLPTLELQHELRQYLESNPLLEQEEDVELTEQTAVEEPSNDKQEEEVEAPDWSDFLNDRDSWESPRREREELERIEKTPVSTPTLHESLLNQVRLVTVDAEEGRIAEFIIGSIDENGRLTIEAEELAELLKLDAEKVKSVIGKIQNLEPPGVGARNLQECLMIQLRARGGEGKLPYRIVAETFDHLAKRRINEIARELHVSLENVQDALDVISHLDPHPGRDLAVADSPYIYPDLIVEKVDGDYEVFLNDRNVPRLRISSAYADILRGDKDRGDKTRTYVERKLSSARWVILAVERRRKTMVEVMKTIVDLQRDFFDKGISHFKPMVLQDVATIVGVHEATVARVTSHKYVQTPRGVFHLKYFFSSKIKTDAGSDASSKAVKARLQTLIDQEDKLHPLSDDKLGAILNDEGFQIRRRTVAKYRDQMGVLNARMRRRV